MPLAWFVWETPVFAHWIVPEMALAVPDGLELDRWQGDPVLSLAGIQAAGPAPRALVRSRLATLVSYTQVNLRTYVRGPDGPGIYILDTRVDRLLPLPARLLGLPYHFDPTAAVSTAGGRVTIHAGGIDLDGTPATDPPLPAPAGSLDAFVLERYVAYGAIDARIRHAPWRTRPLAVERAAIAGWERLGEVAAAHVAEAVEVEVIGVGRGRARFPRRSRWRTSPAPA